jgi:predicted nucleotidyltransferase
MGTPVASVLPAEIESHRAEIDRLCARFGVRRLELFGSAASGAFDPAHSDIDFLVEFDASRRIGALEQYFGFKEALEALFGRAVDLVEQGASQNRYFLESVNESRRLLRWRAGRIEPQPCQGNRS